MPTSSVSSPSGYGGVNSVWRTSCCTSPRVLHVSCAAAAATARPMHFIWFIIVGAIVGALGRLIHPGRDPMGWLLTIAIGVISMIVAAIISGGWLAFVIGVIIAIVLVALVGRFMGTRGTPARA